MPTRCLPPTAVRAAAVVTVLLGVALAGCGAPPDLPPPPPPAPTSAPSASPGGTPSAAPAPTTPPAALPAEAVDCAGTPDVPQVLAVLTDAGLIGPNTDEVAVVEGPLCADDWQFAVVAVPDRDPLQVVTSGPDEELMLVTAGTDVCTVEVRVHAPSGIRTAAGCVG